MPNVIIIAGPNGAGKTTAAPFLLQRTFAITEFVNADFIAQGISVFNPGDAAMEAGRVMLKRLDQLATERARTSPSRLRWPVAVSRRGSQS